MKGARRSFYARSVKVNDSDPDPKVLHVNNLTKRLNGSCSKKIFKGLVHYSHDL